GRQGCSLLEASARRSNSEDVTSVEKSKLTGHTYRLPEAWRAQLSRPQQTPDCRSRTGGSRLLGRSAGGVPWRLSLDGAVHDGLTRPPGFSKTPVYISYQALVVNEVPSYSGTTRTSIWRGTPRSDLLNKSIHWVRRRLRVLVQKNIHPRGVGQASLRTVKGEGWGALYLALSNRTPATRRTEPALTNGKPINGTTVRGAAELRKTFYKNWNYQYKPGPHPKTPEEHAAAAKKYGLTIHAGAEILGGDRCDPSFRPRFSLFQQWTTLIGVLGGATALFFFLEDYKVGRPVTAKQYPGEGQHYYFCPK
ncbi:NADH-ubiquinone oxidoreductase ashi subunit, partial [Operophtera brumata]